MVASSILPVSIHKGKLYFLFGKENEMEDSSKGFSDFGGGVEKNEKIMDAAYREGSEELTGFLGDSKQIKDMIKKRGGTLDICHNDYHVHIFRMEYDENLPLYYNQNHSFLWNRMNKKKLNETSLFEKIEIRWFSLSQMKQHRHLFRGFYREIVDILMGKQTAIKSFLRSRSQSVKKPQQKNTKSKTRKYLRNI